MLLMEPKLKLKNISKDIVIESSKKIEPVEAHLHLPREIQEPKNKFKIITNSKIESSNSIKKRLSIEILNEILRTPDLTKEEVKNIEKLIQKIENNKYYYCYGELFHPNSNIIIYFDQNETTLKKPLLINLPDNLNYDVELYKMGKTCSGLKKRYAIIKMGGFFSSKRPLNQINERNRNTLKDKTPYLSGSKIFKEKKDDPNRTKSEWSNKNKIYRIRIDYPMDHYKNTERAMYSSFFLYFENKNEMEEVELMLFRFVLSEENIIVIKKHLLFMNKLLSKGNKIYIIMKLLSVKNKIKKRKIVMDKINESINKELFGELNIERKFLKRLSLQRKETFQNNLKIDEPHEPECKPIFGVQPLKIVKSYEKQYSDFIPIITNISSNYGYSIYNTNPKLNSKKSLNDLENKVNMLKDEIEYDINEEKNKNSEGICFNISKVEIKKTEIFNYENKNIDFKLESNICKNCKYIFFNKNKPEITFKNDNKVINFSEDNEKIEINKLSDSNIFEISNIILNSNNDMKGKEENNLVILGPKLNNNKGINYKYSNRNNSYADPEYFNIKKQTINWYNKQDIEGISLQIYQSELDINNEKISFLLQNYTKSIILEINSNNLKDSLFFFYKIKLSEMKYIESEYTIPIDYKDQICFIEYNHQYFIPKEYFKNNKKLIIECFCLPRISYSMKEKDMSKEKLGFIGNLLSPLNIGYSIISFEDIKNGKYKYEIENNGVVEPNSFIIIDGGKDKINNLYINYIKGNDYSIGSDTYIEKIIDKAFIDKVKSSVKIPEDLKAKYFNVCFDNETETSFLFRPNENMDENDFIRDISSQISNEDLQKIKNNKKYNFLPFCEKYLDEKALNESKNLQCLTLDQKQYIVNNYEKGDWIYKMQKIKVRLLSKNLGVTKANTLLSQLIYSTGEDVLLPLESLDKNKNTLNKLITVNGNNFNIFDMKEMHNIENLENFQWKISIKFNNSLQMESFKKLLILARQKINTKKKFENLYNYNININPNKIIDFDNQKRYAENELDIYRNYNKCEIKVEYIDFRDDFQLEKDPTLLEVILLIEEEREEKTILTLFLNEKYDFKNSLLEKEEKLRNLLINKYNSHSNMIEKKEYFPKKIKLSKKKFNKGLKKLILGEHLKTQFDLNINNNKISYKLLVILSGIGEFYASLDINEIKNSEMCNKFELPLYKYREDKKIFGCIGIDLYTLDNQKLSFQERYEKLNDRYLKAPQLILKKKKNPNNAKENQYHYHHFGLYEPNVFRREILNFIHNNTDINVDPTDIENSIHKDLDILYQKLFDKCVILPKRENFSSFKFYNLKKNYNIINDINKNVYQKKLGLKLLRTQIHERFMQEFRQKEWEIYLEEINKGQQNLKGIEYYKNIKEKKILLKDKNKANKLHSLIYIGIPSVEYRKIIYSTLLEINKLYQKTREVLFEKTKNDFNNLQQVFSFFANQLFENNKEINLIFSLIDNDSNFICSIENNSLEYINSIKKIAKSFFIWADLRIGLIKKKDKYVYFIGLLNLIHKLYQYFHEDYFVFWILIGLSQNMAHFHQQNPLFTDEMNYINIYGLVSKLILEIHEKEIYNKFISLNFPIEFFLSKHLSSLYSDYFGDELMMRIFDILIFESSFQGLFCDKLQYLRILCAIPITLFQLGKKKIIVCKSVSEIESIFYDLILQTLDYNKFIFSLEKNVNKFYVISNVLERWFFNNKGREWDAKRDKIQNLINSHFSSVYKENTNYLYPISLYLTNNPQQMYNIYFKILDNKLNSIKSLFFKNLSNFDNSNAINGIMVHISNLQQIYNNENNYMEDYKLVMSFGDTEDEIEQKYEKMEIKLCFDNINNKINNISDLFFKEQFKGYNSPNYIHFALTDNQYKIFASFVYRILNLVPMKITPIILENKEEDKKYFLEFLIFKYTNKIIPADDIALYNIIFSPPEYLHSKPIEEKLYSYSISSHSFNIDLSQLIKAQNNNRNIMVNGDIFEQNLIEIYKKLNNNEEYEDKSNKEKFKSIGNCNSFNEKNFQIIMKILSSCLQENIQNLVNKWLNNSNISIEEFFYSIILVDRALLSINEKLFLLFSIAQIKDKLLFNIDDLNISKVKEMVYSLYKRFMIYFTKTDVERMIDFILKDERLFNIKNVFVYNKNDENKINQFVYDKDYYEPRKDKKKLFEIFYDDIKKELNIYFNYLNNHYNMNCISKDILKYILIKILNNMDLTKYIQNKFDTITIIIEKDNMILKKNFSVQYSPLKIEEEYNSMNDVNPKYEEDISNIELCFELSNIYIINNYSSKNYISFDKFKEIFFKLPYLSDLIRVSFSYISENRNEMNNEFDNFKVTIGYEDYFHGIFYFPSKINDNNIEEEHEGNIFYEMNFKIKLFDTVDHILNEIYDKINNKIKLNNNEIIIKDYLKSFDRISCYICYYIKNDSKEGIIKEKIGYFDSLYSIMELKNQSIVGMQIIFDDDLLTFNSSRRLIPRGKGYCKIFYSNNSDFIWKKCKVKSNHISDVILTSTDYKTKPKIINKDDDVVLALDILNH